jgi:hypothetical protein
MRREIWCSGEKIGDSESTEEPKVGDVLELQISDELREYTVSKVYDFSASGRPVRRLEVNYTSSNPRVMVL